MRIITALALLAVAMAPISAEDADGDGYEELGRPMLGVVMTPPTGRDIRNNDLDPDVGVVIRRVYPNSTASQMGLEPGDVITSINNVPIDSMSKMREVVQSYIPGDDVNLVVRRNGQDLANDGFLGSWPETIPFRDIDAKAEDRFRRMQQLRRARQAERLSQLQQQTDQLQRAVEDLRDERERREAATTRPEHPGLALASDLLQGGDLPTLPGWRFHYQVDAGEPAAASHPAATGSIGFRMLVADRLL